MSRQSGFCLAVHQFLDRVKLSSMWEHHPINYAHMHTDHKSVSTIDHFLVNEQLLGLVKDCRHIHLGDNMSHHSPTVVKIDLGSLPAASKIDPQCFSKICTYRLGMYYALHFDWWGGKKCTLCFAQRAKNG